MARDITVKFRGRDLNLFLDGEADESVYEEIFVDRDYRVLDDFLKQASVVVDIGAHIGLFSLYAAVCGADEIHAFEPEERNYAALKKHMKMNRVNNVRSKNLAVVGTESERKLFISEDSHNHSLFEEGNGEGRPVNTIAISKLMGKIGFCDVMKMDCEGAEFEIIQAMKAEHFKQIGTLYIEYHQYLKHFRAGDLIGKLKKYYPSVRDFVSQYDRRMGFVLATNIT